MSYVFLFLYAIFPPSLIFTQVAASVSHFLTAATKFHVVPPTKSVRCLLRKKKNENKNKKKNSTLFMKQRFIDTANDTPTHKKVLT